MKHIVKQSSIALEALDAVSGGANPFDALSALAGVFAGIDRSDSYQEDPYAYSQPQPPQTQYVPQYVPDYTPQHVPQHSAPRYTVSPTTSGNEYGYENFHF